MTTPPKRRWFRFGLRTMFVLVTVAAVCAFLGPTAMTVYRRRQARNSIIANGGTIYLQSDYTAQELEENGLTTTRVSGLRRLMGDEAAVIILLRRGAAENEIEQMLLIFPEAQTQSTPGINGGGFF